MVLVWALDRFSSRSGLTGTVVDLQRLSFRRHAEEHL
jgi:DNA invertase Pin-like site-specific DNA recombinase